MSFFFPWTFGKDNRSTTEKGQMCDSILVSKVGVYFIAPMRSGCQAGVSGTDTEWQHH
jgi:hypothetical protein